LTHKKRKPRRKIVAITRQELEASQVPGFEPGVMLDTQQRESAEPSNIVQHLIA
jgi:hypothetical protein